MLQRCPPSHHCVLLLPLLLLFYRPCSSATDKLTSQVFVCAPDFRNIRSVGSSIQLRE
jgi:hypothetical protein